LKIWRALEDTFSISNKFTRSNNNFIVNDEFLEGFCKIQRNSKSDEIINKANQSNDIEPDIQIISIVLLDNGERKCANKNDINYDLE
jgi:hypothetical protein